MRYRLDVVAPSVTEAVRAAGGWMFDRVMAGWDVRVLLHDYHDDEAGSTGNTCGATAERALQILGADTGDLETALAGGPNGLRPHALAVAADLYGRDARIRDGVRQALSSGKTEVTLWGESWPSDLDRSSVDSVEHRLSVAARAFKAQALAALETQEAQDARLLIGNTETFRSGTPACCPVAADLVPAS